MKYFLLVLLVFIGNFVFSQKNSTETRYNCIAYWKKGDTKTYVIKRKKEKISPGKTERDENFVIETKITILDSTANSYTISWVYGIPDEAKENPLMHSIASFFKDMKFIYKTDEIGSFTELVNWEEIRDFYVKMLEMQFEGQKKDSSMQKIIDQTLALFQSREMVEATMIKEIQLFHTPFGTAFSTKDTSINTKVKVPIFNDSMPANQHWRITEIGDVGASLKLEIRQEFDSIGAAKLIEEFIKKVNPAEKMGISKIKEQVSAYDVSDNSEFKIVRSTGWLKGCSFIRSVKVGDVIQTEVCTIEGRE